MASPEELKKAYKRAVLQYHPDRYANSPAEFQELAEQRTKLLRTAYDKLMARFSVNGG